MSLDVINTAAAVGTFLVIGATAIAAVVQLRHLRAGNQLQGLLIALAQIEHDDFNTWFTRTQEELPALMSDPAFRRSFAERRYDRNAPWVKLANSYDGVGNLVKNGLLPEGPFLDNASFRIVSAWEMLSDLTAVVRRDAGPAVWGNFEFIYMRARVWMRAYPNGDYPANVPHADIPDPYLEEDLRLRAAAQAEAPSG